MHSQFPALRSTLERMNAAQMFYGFEIVDLSVPLDAWHTIDGKRYLDADRFADRLAPQIPQLGVRYLAAIIDEWMACDIASKSPDTEIYGWWPEKNKPPVLIFSTKGLRLEPKGSTTDRAIANVTVSGIAGYLMNIDSHRKGPRDCPNYYNPKRSFDVLTGRQKFCRSCAEKLRKAYPDEYEALVTILGLFD
jgi:hypothetical protein